MIPGNRTVIECWGQKSNNNLDTLGYIKVEYDGEVVYDGTMTELYAGGIVTAHEGPAEKHLKITLYGSTAKSGAQEDYHIYRFTNNVYNHKCDLYGYPTFEKLYEGHTNTDRVIELDIPADVRKVIIQPGIRCAAIPYVTNEFIDINQFTY